LHFKCHSKARASRTRRLTPRAIEA
jgi:hypothetical protein